MSDEKPIFKCIDAKTHSKNNWYDNLMKFTEQHESDIAELEEKGMITDISGRHYIDEKIVWLEENMERHTDEANEIVAKLKERFKDD
jgi:hypothetical protein